MDGQKAFMTGKLKTKGNMMFATKLDGVLKVRPLILTKCWMNIHVYGSIGHQGEGKVVNCPALFICIPHDIYQYHNPAVSHDRMYCLSKCVYSTRISTGIS